MDDKTGTRGKLFLIGMMGAGKTSVGKALARSLELPFVDLDRRIHEVSGSSIEGLFRQEGEAEFRRIEARTLRDLAKDSSQAVIACGGGTPCYHGNLAEMKESGNVVYLKCDTDVLVDRLLNNGEVRPLIEEVNRDRAKLTSRIESLLDERVPVYEQADITLDTTASDIYGVVRDLIMKLGNGS